MSDENRIHVPHVAESGGEICGDGATEEVDLFEGRHVVCAGEVQAISLLSW